MQRQRNSYLLAKKRRQSQRLPSSANDSENNDGIYFGEDGCADEDREPARISGTSESMPLKFNRDISA